MDRSTAETWEDMVEAPGLDGITLDLWGGGGGTLRSVKCVDRSTNKRTIPSLFSYISTGVCEI